MLNAEVSRASIFFCVTDVRICLGRCLRTVKRNVSIKIINFCEENKKQQASSSWEHLILQHILTHTQGSSPYGPRPDRYNRFNIISYLRTQVNRMSQQKLYFLWNIRYASLGAEAYRVSAHLVFDRNTEVITTHKTCKLLFMGTAFESKPAQGPHLFLKPIS